MDDLLLTMFLVRFGTKKQDRDDKKKSVSFFSFS